jgi:acyl-CoA thioesterase YciA
MQTATQPQGQMTLRTQAMPRDANAYGDIFGGWVVSQMDLGGALLAKEVARGRVVTVSIDKMSFVHPVFVGDTLGVYARVIKIGNTSVDIGLEVWAKDLLGDFDTQQHLVTTGLFRYVAVDEARKPTPIPKHMRQTLG